ncbi:hypothetical protein Tco_1129065 [Tanacetum coccineum]
MLSRVGDEKVVVGEGVVVTSSSLEMLTNSLGGIMVSLIFLKGLEEEALVEFMVKYSGVNTMKNNVRIDKIERSSRGRVLAHKVPLCLPCPSSSSSFKNEKGMVVKVQKRRSGSDDLISLWPVNLS